MPLPLPPVGVHSACIRCRDSILYRLVLAYFTAHNDWASQHNITIMCRVMKALSDCCSCNHFLDVRSTMLLVRQNVGSCYTYAAMPETDVFDPKGDCYCIQNQIYERSL
jgi:hypothetical protein